MNQLGTTHIKLYIYIWSYDYQIKKIYTLLDCMSEKKDTLDSNARGNENESIMFYQCKE